MTPALAARELRRYFEEEKAVDGVDLEVQTGEIHAIVGLNGAGKTTLMRLLLGMLRPDSGRAMVLDEEAGAASPEILQRVGHLIETPFAYPELTVRENLRASALLRGVTPPDDAADSMIDQFELAHWADRRAGTLSLGNRQRLGLGSALVHRPTVLVLDEPANALDPAGVVFIRDLMRSLADQDAAVLVSSHHLDQLARVAHTISVMHRGRIVGSLDPRESDLEQRFFDLVYRYDLEAAS
jgi:ABC-2 type transport system ATP-binding protein